MSLTAAGLLTANAGTAYDWTQVEDPELLKKNLFPVVTEEQMEESLSLLASAVA